MPADHAISRRRRSRGRGGVARLSVALIALALLFTLMWILSMLRGYGVNVYTEVMAPPVGGYTSHQRAIASGHGRLWFAYVRAEFVNESARHEKRRRMYVARLPEEDPASRYDAPTWLAAVGIDWRGKDDSSVDPQQGPYVYHELLFSVPYWILVALFGGVGWWIGRRPRLVRRRLRRGLCPACGYDVRATPEQCPECGISAPATGAPR